MVIRSSSINSFISQRMIVHPIQHDRDWVRNKSLNISRDHKMFERNNASGKSWKNIDMNYSDCLQDIIITITISSNSSREYESRRGIIIWRKKAVNRSININEIVFTRDQFTFFINMNELYSAAAGELFDRTGIGIEIGKVKMKVPQRLNMRARLPFQCS